MRKRKLLLSLLSAALLGAFANNALAGTDFYQNKTVTVVVPYGPGGGYDTWARLAAPYLKKYLDLKKVKIVNKPGAGGLIGTIAVYNAKPDGLTIGDTTAAGDLIDQIMGAPGAQFDVGKFNWLGRPDRPAECLVVRPDGRYQTFSDLLKVKGSAETVKLLTPGRGSSAYDAAVMTFNALGVPYNAVSPFKGSHAASAAFVSGLGDTLVLPVVDAQKLGDSVKIIAILSAESFGGIDAPTISSLGATENVSEHTQSLLKMIAGVNDLGHAWFAPPGVPDDRLAALRQAFKQTVHDPAFVKQAEKAGFRVKYASGQTLSSIVKQGLADKDVFKTLLPGNTQ